MIGEQNPDPPLADAKSTQSELLKPVLKKLNHGGRGTQSITEKITV
jgi:hypothetical protein